MLLSLVDRWWLAFALATGLVLVAPSAAIAELEIEAEVASDAEVEAEPEHDEAEHDSDDDYAEHGDGHADEHGEHGDGHEEAAPDPLATDPDLAIWTLIVFVAMLAILSQVAWGPIMDGLKAREDGIVSKLEAAEKANEEAKALVAEHQAQLAGAADQVRELLEEARRDADTTMAQAKADAKAEFDAERQRATRDIEQASDAAVRQLAEKTAGLAIDLAGRVVKHELTPQRQDEIVREALGRFANTDPSAN